MTSQWAGTNKLSALHWHSWIIIMAKQGKGRLYQNCYALQLVHLPEPCVVMTVSRTVLTKQLSWVNNSMIGHQPPVRCSHSLVRSRSLSLSCCQREISTSNKGLHKNDISSDNFNNKVISITIYKSYRWSFHIKNLRQVSINLRLWGSLGAPEWQAGRAGPPLLGTPAAQFSVASYHPIPILCM